MGGKSSLVMKFNNLSNTIKDKFLSKNSTKYVAWKLAPIPVLFLENPEKEVRGSLHAGFEIF